MIAPVVVIETAGLHKDCLCKAVPAECLGLGEVVDAPVVFDFWQYLQYKADNFSGGGWLAYLVVDNVHLFAHGTYVKHGFDKVVAVFREYPAGTKDQVFAVYLGDGFFSGEFAGAVYSQWGCWVIFEPGALFTAVKEIVGGEVD